MQQESPEISERRPQSTHPNVSTVSSQNGSLSHDSSDLQRVSSGGSHSSPSRHVLEPGGDAADGIHAHQLDEKLRGLNVRSLDSHRRSSARGQRVSDYENTLTPRTPRHALGFRVIKRRDPSSEGVQLSDFPNGLSGPNACNVRTMLTLYAEVLTHILSHLHPDSHASVALVSKRFYALVTTPHTWRMAFMRYFPGTNAEETQSATGDLWAGPKSDLVRSETRYFPRLTLLATWRSEYLFRTRLLRNLARGKPGASAGGIGKSSRTGQSDKKANAVLTYNSKLPWLVTDVHAVFVNGKKPPRAIQATSGLGVATISDPATGKVEKWGLEDPFMAAQVDEVMPNLVLYGLAEGPTACPNVIDVSQPYGMLAGEGHPGGRAYFRGVNEMRGRYLEADNGLTDTYPDIPRIPEMSEAISSLWIAKSSAVPAVTSSMFGMLTGSTLGVVTAYSLGWDPSGSRYTNGAITCRWILSPGVPIISVKVDDHFNVKRRSCRRVWAVALNALGEVFYLTEVPTTTLKGTPGDDLTKNAWYSGRTVYWHLIESTRRVARQHEWDKNAVRGAYSPRSPSDSMNLSQEQLVAEAREIEKFLRHKPAHFRKVCDGWDMQRRLEVDFASDDGQGYGENIFLIDCGLAEGRQSHIQRYTRTDFNDKKAVDETETTYPNPPVHSLFGGLNTALLARARSPEPQPPRPHPPNPHSPGSPSVLVHDWQCCTLKMKDHAQAAISVTALDCSTSSQITLSEDHLHLGGQTATPGKNSWKEDGTGEIPGRRARFFTVGTKSGAVLVWNARERDKTRRISPLRIFQTDSPEISSVAATALYIVHGGSDGLVQAWDPLASSLEPIRTLNARSNGRVPRHMVAMNQAFRDGNYSAVGAIYLDPDPTALRGIVSFGAFLRYWTYSSRNHVAGRKRRLRQRDVHGRLASRRQGGAVVGYIAAEEAELRRENEQRAREQSRLRKRFGVGALGDLTEEEAIRYAQMISEEAYVMEEQRRASDSAADASLEAASSYSETTTTDTVASGCHSGIADSPSLKPVTDDEEDFEQQIQQAIRLSLLEGVNDLGQSPRGNGSGEYEFSIKSAQTGPRTCKGPGSSSASMSQTHTPVNGLAAGPSIQQAEEDEDLALALSLSLQNQGGPTPCQVSRKRGHHVGPEPFPPLESPGAGTSARTSKGKGVTKW